MSSPSRASIITGPAKIVYGNTSSPTTLWSKGDFTVTPKLETFPVNVSAMGTVSERIKQRNIEVQVTLDGEWSSAVKAALWPYAAASVDAFPIGTSISKDPSSGLAVGSDLSLAITPINGFPITGKAAFLTKPPSLKFTSVDTRIGAATFMVLGADGTYWSDANSLYTLGSSGTSDWSGFLETDIKTEGCLATWSPGIGAITAFDTLDGFTVDFDLKYQAREVDTVGIVDFTLTSLDVTIKCTPIGMTETQLLGSSAVMNLQGTNASRGADVANSNYAGDFVISNLSPSVLFAARQMTLIEAPLLYGQANRFGQCTWKSTRKVASNALKSVFNFGTLS